jgi:hypothetical protein
LNTYIALTQQSNLLVESKSKLIDICFIIFLHFCKDCRTFCEGERDLPLIGVNCLIKLSDIIDFIGVIGLIGLDGLVRIVGLSCLNDLIGLIDLVKLGIVRHNGLDVLIGLIIGTIKDGYVRNVPLPRVPQIQTTSPTASHESITPKAGILIPGYLHVPSWIPTLPKLGSILGFSQRLL